MEFLDTGRLLMIVDWELVAKLGIPIVTAVVVAIVSQALAHRPRLIAYFSSISAFPVPDAGGNAPAPPQTPALPAPAPGFPPATPPAGGGAPTPGAIHSHAIVVRNVGKKSAFNVRVGHLANIVAFQLAPPVNHSVAVNQNGGWEILIPALVPDEQVQVSYLYVPPLTANLVNSYIKSDEISAQIINVLPTPQPSPLRRIIGYLLFYLGLVTFTYLVILVAHWVYRLNTLVGHP
jgi:hypothetical protein